MRHLKNILWRKPRPRALLLLGLTLGAALLFWPARSMRSDNFVFYFPGSHQVVPMEVIAGTKYLPLLKVLNQVIKVEGLQEKDKSVTVWSGKTHLELHADDKRARVDKQWIPLRDPIRVSNGQWMVPVDFLTSVLPRFTHEAISYQVGTNRILIGNVKTTSFSLRLDPLPNGARLTIQFTDHVTVTTEAKEGGWVMSLGGQAVEPLEPSYGFQNPYVRELRFDDEDGAPKLILTPTTSGLNFSPALAEGGKVLLADVLKPPPVVAEQQPRPPEIPAAAPPAPPAPIVIEESPVTEPGVTLPLVVLDAGHGGPDTGGRSRDGVLEKNLVAQLVARVRVALLETKKYRILLTRVGDNSPTFEQRETAANSARPSVFLTFHAGNLGNSTPRVAVYHFQASSPAAADVPEELRGILVPWQRVQQAHLERSRQLAEVLQQHLAQILGVLTDPPAAAPVRALRSVDAPALAIEIGSLSPEADAEPLSAPTFQQQISTAIAEALADFQGKAS